MEIIGELAAAQGYDFYYGPEEALAATVRRGPAVWLAPPELAAAEGVDDRLDTYALTLTVIGGRELPRGPADVPQGAAGSASRLAGPVEAGVQLPAPPEAAAGIFRAAALHASTRGAAGLKVWRLRKPVTPDGRDAWRAEFRLKIGYYA